MSPLFQNLIPRGSWAQQLTLRTGLGEGGEALHLLNDVLRGADTGRFDDRARLLGGNVVHLDKEAVL